MIRVRRDNQQQNRYALIFPILTIVMIGIITAFVTHYQPNWNYNWVGIRKEIKDSIEVSALCGITSGFGGMGISTKGEVDRRQWIMGNATQSELLQLTEYPNGTVKAIAYEGLLRKKEFANKMELTLRAIQDTLYLVDYQSGCFIWNREIGEYLVQDVLMIDDQAPPFPPEIQTEFGLTEIEKQKILTEYRRRAKREN